MAQRYDIGELKRPTRQPNGWLRVDGLLTRSGVFPYRNHDGSTRLEYRPADEVFKADSLESFALVPFTNDHPPVPLDATNTKAFAVGSIGENVRREGDHVRASILVTDEATASQMESGKVALSCGYSCDLDETPGEINGVRYDAVQRNIRGNHVALVDVARAGPTAKVRMDAGDAVQVSDTHPRPSDPPGTKERTMLVKMKIDGVEVEVTETAKQVVEKHLAAVTARADTAEAQLAASKSESAKQAARADTAEAQLAAEKKLRVDAESPAKIREQVKARVALETVASKVLGGDFKADADDAAIKVAIVEKVDGVKLDGDKAKAGPYLDARFDSVVARVQKADPLVDEIRNGNGERADNAEPTDVASRFDRMQEFVSNAWNRKDKAADGEDD